MVSCRGCSAQLSLSFLDLGASPIANDLISGETLVSPEVFYPLHVMTCTNCSLVQIPEVAKREALFRSDYVYFSSYSTSWLEHSQAYASKMLELLDLSDQDLVIEVASNDGYLLQYFTENGVQVLGIEPSSGVAEVAIKKGISTVVDFFGTELAKKLAFEKKPKLMLGNNVLAHVPDLHDFIKGFSILIAPEGLVTFEFPHIVSLIKNNQFDTIYHEHYSYLSVTSLLPIFESHGLRITEVEKLNTHGGSIRIYVARTDSSWETSDSVSIILQEEAENDPRNKVIWRLLQEKTLRVKIDLLEELVKCKRQGIKVAAYGAAAKGNTLLNYCGIDSDLVNYVVDLNPRKQGNYLPGSRIPIVGLEHLTENTPDVLLVLPWNLADEINSQLSNFTNAGLKLLRAVPNLEYF
jgi:2-polyprenyl-3-methyl-5-hydroxy-6-metoxy-1,4-benzoquinol methylase